MGDRLGTLQKARADLANIMRVTATAPVYETAPLYVTDQPTFLNSALVGTTALLPHDLLIELQALEKAAGREPSVRYGPRTLDLDILLYGDMCLEARDLVIPHPQMTERAFVLRPLADIAGDWVHPATGKTVSTLLNALPQGDGARKVGEL